MSEVKIIAGRYHVQRAIGSGARGQVYLAHDPLLNTLVAIKMLHHNDSDDAVIRFQHEAVATGKLKHPRIARTLDFGVADGLLYMVMEFVDGQSLGALLNKLTVLPVERALPLFIDICAGLAHAHAIGILHRDLKPDNVIVVQSEEDGEYAKLVDFGIAKIQGDNLVLTDPNALVGSPIYMSPEQCNNQPADVRSDIYSLGCLMFETLSGKPPFLGDTALDTIRMKTSEDPPKLSAVMDTSKVPEELAKIVDTCLRRNQEQRFQNVSAIAQALDEITLEEESAVPTAEVVVSRKRINSKLVFIGLSLVALLITGGLAMMQIWFGRNNDAISKKTTSIREVVEPFHFYTGSAGTRPMLTVTDEALSSTLADPKGLRLKIQQSLPAPRAGNEEKSFQFDKKTPGRVKVRTYAQDGDLKVLANRKDLTVIDFDHAGSLTGEGFKYIEKLPLVEVYIDQTNMHDVALEHISRIPTLQTVFITKASQFTDEGLKHLRNCKNLNNFEIADDLITNNGIAYLSAIKSLRYLGVTHSTDVNDGCINSLNAMPNLVNLSLNYSGITADGIIRLAHSSRKIAELRLDAMPWSAESFKALSTLPHLKLLSMRDANVTNEMLHHLLGLRSLENLTIEGRSLSGDSLGVLKDHPTLAHLAIHDLKASTPMLRALGSLKVFSLHLQHTANIDDSMLVLLLNMPNLRSLTLFDCDTKTVTLHGMQTFQKSYFKRWHRHCAITYDVRGHEHVNDF